MIEVLVTLMFVSFAFLPIYNLFRFGQRGTWSNEKEIVNTNFAGDLINYMREISVADLDKCFPSAKSEIKLADETQIKAALKRINMTPPDCPLPQVGVIRSMTLQRFEGLPGTLLGKLFDLFTQRVAVPNFLVTVTVNYHKPGMSMGEDEVTLSTIVMD